MNKKLLLSVLALLLLIVVAVPLLAACSEVKQKEYNADDDPKESVTGEKEGEMTDPPVDTDNVETDDVETEAATDAPVNEPEPFVPYIERIEDPIYAIYAGPGYDHEYVGMVGVVGAFTIVEEKTDASGSLWGRLKSGAGWVDLTYNRALKNKSIDVHYTEAGEKIERMIAVDEGAYVSFLTVEAKVGVTVSLYKMGYVGSVEEKVYLESATLDAGEKIGVQYAFTDTGSLIIEAARSDGDKQVYVVYQSGKDGSLVCSLQK